MCRGCCAVPITTPMLSANVRGVVHTRYGSIFRYVRLRYKARGRVVSSEREWALLPSFVALHGRFDPLGGTYFGSDPIQAASDVGLQRARK